MKNWLKSFVLAGVVAGTLASANAAMWTDFTGFDAAMIRENGQPLFFDLTNPSMVNGYSYNTDPSGYGYRVANRGLVRLTFSAPADAGPGPTGVGGFFPAGATLTFSFVGTEASPGASFTIRTTEPGFFGYTTDVPPASLSISSLSFAASTLPSRLIAGLDVVQVAVPEPTSVLAGVLLLLPFAASAVSRSRRNR